MNGKKLIAVFVLTVSVARADIFSYDDGSGVSETFSVYPVAFPENTDLWVISGGTPSDYASFLSDGVPVVDFARAGLYGSGEPYYHAAVDLYAVGNPDRVSRNNYDSFALVGPALGFTAPPSIANPYVNPSSGFAFVAVIVKVGAVLVGVAITTILALFAYKKLAGAK